VPVSATQPSQVSSVTTPEIRAHVSTWRERIPESCNTTPPPGVPPLDDDQEDAMDRLERWVDENRWPFPPGWTEAVMQRVVRVDERSAGSLHSNPQESQQINLRTGERGALWSQSSRRRAGIRTTSSAQRAARRFSR
jgi:hypothetical protein